MKKWIAMVKGKEVPIEEYNMKTSWEDIKDNVNSLSFDNNGQLISLPSGMDEYIQAKTASAELGSDDIEIESRYIGFKLGNNTIRIRINEKTQNISVEVN